MFYQFNVYFCKKKNGMETIIISDNEGSVKVRKINLSVCIHQDMDMVVLHHINIPDLISALQTAYNEINPHPVTKQNDSEVIDEIIETASALCDYQLYRNKFSEYLNTYFNITKK